MGETFEQVLKLNERAMDIHGSHEHDCTDSDACWKQGVAESSFGDLSLDAIEARANAATAGPWHVSGGTDGEKSRWSHDGEGATIYRDGSELNPVVVGGCQDEQGGAIGVLKNSDAEFIAHAREDVPAMLAALRAARTITPEQLEVAIKALFEHNMREKGVFIGETHQLSLDTLSRYQRKVSSIFKALGYTLPSEGGLRP